ncbi:MAG: flavin reductase family protein [Anaerolineales bacterium]|nr:flavin reductase family protein [Anaerolineales bacterium]MCX7607773.1 flavin reductase family protein [Anaerolineales bacterium]MDW8227013.1 flavin reductase family protein [Anaerolineales bacterium]
MKVHPEQLRQAMRRWTSGVAIVTARYQDQIHGMTVSAFTSVSLSPPLVLVSLANTTRTGEMIRQAGCFGVTVLAEDQREVSEIFAGRVPDTANRFAGIETETLESGVPFIKGGLIYLDCHLIQTVLVGSTTLYIGEVIALAEKSNKRPLVYHNREYQRLHMS